MVIYYESDNDSEGYFKVKFCIVGFVQYFGGLKYSCRYSLDLFDLKVYCFDQWLIF